MAMNPGMKMLAMARVAQGGRMGNDHMTRMGGYGREMDDRPEMRRRRDDRGRFMEGEGDMRMGNDHSTYMGGYDRDMREKETERNHPKHDNPYGDDPEKYKRHREEPKMTGTDYRYRRPDGGEGRLQYFRVNHETDPLEQHGKRKNQQMGFQQLEQDEGLDKRTAMEWVESMEDADGVKGGMYSWHQTQQYGRNLGITGEERLIEFYAAMNAMYSDFRPAAKKFGVDKPEFYAMMAKCFMEDPDAVEDKVAVYYECIARKE